jgi:hypothetical protein
MPGRNQFAAGRTTSLRLGYSSTEHIPLRNKNIFPTNITIQLKKQIGKTQNLNVKTQ